MISITGRYSLVNEYFVKYVHMYPLFCRLICMRCCCLKTGLALHSRYLTIAYVQHTITYKQCLKVVRFITFGNIIHLYLLDTGRLVSRLKPKHVVTERTLGGSNENDLCCFYQDFSSSKSQHERTVKKSCN